MTSSVRNSAPISTTVWLTLLCMLAVISALPVQAQTLTVLHSFTAGADGGNPAAGLTIDGGGKLYGTTSGYYGNETSSAFALKAAGAGWLLNPLLDFGYPDRELYGYGLYSKLVFGPDGALYGSAQTGGTEGCGNLGCGTIFRLQPGPRTCPASACDWNVTVLFYFSPGSGALPDQIIFGPDGSIYGTTLLGGTLNGDCPSYGCGTVFQMTNSGGTWSRKILYEFHGTDGNYPVGGVILDSAGNLYGTTNRGGNDDLGVVYKLSPTAQGPWTQTILHQGNNPVGPLTMDAAGNLYGVNTGGSLGVGSAFELSPPGTWNYQTLYTFYGHGMAQGGLLLDSSGNIYGSLTSSGPDHAGSIYKLTPTNGSWSYTDLYDFHNEPDGEFPNGGLVMDAQGNLYGTCAWGGSLGAAYGTAWKFTP